MKRLKRLKCREYNNHRSSIKWKDLNDKYKEALIQAKSQYYKNIIKDLKVSNPSQWYSKLKRICSYDQEKHDPLVVAEIELLSDQAQAEKCSFSNFCRLEGRLSKPMPQIRNSSIPKLWSQTSPNSCPHKLFSKPKCYSKVAWKKVQTKTCTWRRTPRGLPGKFRIQSPIQQKC